MEQLSTISTSILTTIITMTLVNYLKQKMDNHDVRERKRKAVLTSLIAETECLLYLIKSRLKEVENIAEETKASIYFPISGDYFRVFDSLAADLSVLKSSKIINSTIHTYMETKGLFDDVKGLSFNSLELRKGLLRKDGQITPILAQFISSQTIYFNNIVYDRAPLICEKLKDLIIILRNNSQN